jgi:uncharacterized protein (TIGR03435 family)
MDQRAAVAAVAGFLMVGPAIQAIAQDQPVSQDTARFEVASVRPHRSADDVMFALQFHEGGRLTATGTLRMLIRTAYRLQESQVEGASGWMDEDRFDLDGRAGPNATPGELRVMLRALLRERFGLVLRAERKDAAVYALRASRGERGPRLRPAAQPCPSGACDIRLAPGVLSARGVTMETLANELSWWVDRIVTDQTSLRDRFDLELEWAPDVFPPLLSVLPTPNAPAIGRFDSNAPSIFTAVREQLGLTLEPERGEVDVFVIDRAERPTAN